MLGRGRKLGGLRDGRGVDLRGRTEPLGSPEVSGEGHEDDEQDPNSADEGELVLLKALPGVAPEGAALLGGRGRGLDGLDGLVGGVLLLFDRHSAHLP